MTTWLQATTIYVLLVIAPGGLDSQLGVYADLPACEAARGAYQVQQPLKAVCVERERR
jgi:hypothetical protein